jgi:hypothetical protein
LSITSQQVKMYPSMLKRCKVAICLEQWRKSLQIAVQRQTMISC